MTEENERKSCEQCGQQFAVSELIIDEESGLRLCPVCSRELDSCGCSDEAE